MGSKRILFLLSARSARQLTELLEVSRSLAAAAAAEPGGWQRAGAALSLIDQHLAVLLETLRQQGLTAAAGWPGGLQPPPGLARRQRHSTRPS